MYVTVAAAFSALVLVGCVENDDDQGKENRDNPGGLGGDSKLVGDWLVDDVNGNNEKAVISFKPSGDFAGAYFQKIGNFWIEGTLGDGDKWSAKNGEIIVFHPDYPGENDTIQYAISGNTLTITGTDYECDWDGGKETCHKTGDFVETYTKINLSSLRSSFGTVHTANKTLNGDWTLQTGEVLKLYTYTCSGIGFYEYSQRYLTDYYDDKAWYTNGTRLFLLGLDKGDCKMIYNKWNDDHYEGDCSYTVAESIELNYSIASSGGVRTLTLTNSALGINDVWSERQYDYNNSMAKRSNAAKRSNEKYKKPFKIFSRTVR